MAHSALQLHHGDRVRVGTYDGRLGTVIRCRKKNGSSHYFKIKLDDGEWLWPDHVVADSRGQYDCTCRECEIPFKSDDIGEIFCPNCTRRQNAELQAAGREAGGPRFPMRWKHEDRGQGRRRW